MDGSWCARRSLEVIPPIVTCHCNKVKHRREFYKLMLQNRGWEWLMEEWV